MGASSVSATLRQLVQRDARLTSVSMRLRGEDILARLPWVSFGVLSNLASCIGSKDAEGRVSRLKAVVVMASVGVGRLWAVGMRELEMTKSWQVLSVEVRLYRPRFFP